MISLQMQRMNKGMQKLSRSIIVSTLLVCIRICISMIGSLSPVSFSLIFTLQLKFAGTGTITTFPPPPSPPRPYAAPIQVHLSRSLSLHTEQKANHDEVKSLAMSVANTSLLRIHSFFFLRIYFIRISRLKFAKFRNILRKKPRLRLILKRIDIILCVETSVNTVQYYVFNLPYKIIPFSERRNQPTKRKNLHKLQKNVQH